MLSTLACEGNYPPSHGWGRYVVLESGFHVRVRFFRGFRLSTKTGQTFPNSRIFPKKEQPSNEVSINTKTMGTT